MVVFMQTFSVSGREKTVSEPKARYYVSKVVLSMTNSCPELTNGYTNLIRVLFYFGFT